MRCERCGVTTLVATMSRFNTDMICMPCEAVERAHPRYEEAASAELAAVQRGDFNYPGIGLPADLAGTRDARR